MGSSILNRLKRLHDDNSGQMMIILGIAAIPLMIVAGFAIDFQLVTTKKTKAQYTLDSAVIASGRDMQAGSTDDEVKAYLSQYFLAAMNSDEGSLSCVNPTVTITSQTIKATTLCSQATTLSALAGINELKFRVSSASEYGIGKVDVAFVFDVSGSMKGSRMDALKDAAVVAVDQLLPLNPAVGREDDVRLAMVSYNNSMNAGDLYEIVTGEATTQTHTYYDKYANKYVDVEYQTTCVFQRKGSEKFSDAAPGESAYMTPASYWDRDDCRDAEPVPLTSTREPLYTYINSLDPSGGTAGHLGVAWGWYMLSPKWTSFLPAASAPMPYNEKDTAKALILMTDGAFNATVDNSQGSSTYQAKQICDNVKDTGIVVYSIAFQAPEAGQEVLKYCASGAEYYFSPESGSELAQAYKAIATSISDLRLTM